MKVGDKVILPSTHYLFETIDNYPGEISAIFEEYAVVVVDLPTYSVQTSCPLEELKPFLVN